MPAAPEPFLPDLFAFFGEVYVRRMFGGKGLFAADVMIGIVTGDTVYLKTDETTRAAYLAEGSDAYTFHMKRGAIATSFYRVPDRLYDEPEEFAEWVRRAHAIAERSSSVQRKRNLTGRKAAKRPIHRGAKPGILSR